MVDLLITGAHGQLGRALDRRADRRGLMTASHDIDTVDIRDAGAVERLVAAASPRWLVNCAAHTDVDGCERDEAGAYALNAGAVENLARACGDRAVVLVHVSTDYVFSGDAHRPYREDDFTAPRTVYGRTKLAGEQYARTAPEHLIVRTAWLYGLGGRHFIGEIQRQVASGAERLRVVADQTGCPTFADDLAELILDLLSVNARGVVHASNSGQATWHQLATEVVRRSGTTIPVDPVDTEEFPRPAPRPRYSVLDLSRLASLIGRTPPSWQDGLTRYLEAACAS